MLEEKKVRILVRRNGIIEVEDANKQILFKTNKELRSVASVRKYIQRSMIALPGTAIEVIHEDNPTPDRVVLRYSLIKTARRLTFDILEQDPETIWDGDDDGDYHKFVASNGYEVISRSRMDIQTERLWLLGAKHKEDPRSGTMVFSSNEKRDDAYSKFVEAIDQWATGYGGIAVRMSPQ